MLLKARQALLPHAAMETAAVGGREWLAGSGSARIKAVGPGVCRTLASEDLPPFPASSTIHFKEF